MTWRLRPQVNKAKGEMWSGKGETKENFLVAMVEKKEFHIFFKGEGGDDF